MSDHSIETVEVWKDIPGYEGLYQVSNLGRVKSLERKRDTSRDNSIVHERIMKPTSKGQKLGHLRVALRKQQKYKRIFVHVLVLTAFVGPCPRGKRCRHYPDPNPANNKLSNLQWGTQSENEKDKITHGTSNHGQAHPMSKLDNRKVLRIRELHKTGKLSLTQIGNMFGVGAPCICGIIKGNTWTHI